jgi:hypothetical protein
VISLLIRSVVAAVVGALVALAALALAYRSHPALVVEMDRNASALISGLYDAERVGRETFAWTRDRATMTLPGLDRSREWSCTVRLRGGRADASTLPQILISVDGMIVRTSAVTNDFQDLTVTLPARERSGAAISLASSSTFVPGPSDRRALGVVVDRWTCAPVTAGFVRPPRVVSLASAIGGAAFGAALALIGAGGLAIAAGVALLAAAQAWPLSWGFGMFTPYPNRAAWLAIWIAAALVVTIRGTERVLQRPLTGAARFVAAFTAGVLYLKLLALVHPSKQIVDIVFHAHRLQWVVEGRFYFTQPMPDGVRFPYAIGLYVIAAPFTLLTDDFGFLLRVIVTTAEAVGAILVYRVLAAVWQDRLAGAVAGGLFHLVPRTFEIVGNANMTNAFAQSTALAALAAAVLLPLPRGARLQLAALTVLTALALLSHISTFTLLSGILIVLAGLYWLRGDPATRGAALRVLVAVIIAAVVSVALYYAHFGDAYRTAARVRATPAAATAPAGAPSAAPAEDGVGLQEKVREAARLTVAAVGWPIFLLALGGLAALWFRGFRDRLSLALLALLATLLLFITAVVAMPVERSFQRYAAEFISRVTLATYPALVMLAGAAAAWGFRRGWPWRLAVAGVLLAALSLGVTTWTNWLR